MATFEDLLGKKIVAFRGYPHRDSLLNKIVTNLDFILFDDEETLIEIKEQDYYEFHDCSPSARQIRIMKDKSLWKRLFNKDGAGEPDSYYI